jgi:hypothetical protein
MRSLLCGCTLRVTSVTDRRLPRSSLSARCGAAIRPGHTPGGPQPEPCNLSRNSTTVPPPPETPRGVTSQSSTATWVCGRTQGGSCAAGRPPQCIRGSIRHRPAWTPSRARAHLCARTAHLGSGSAAGRATTRPHKSQAVASSLGATHVRKELLPHRVLGKVHTLLLWSRSKCRLRECGCAPLMLCCCAVVALLHFSLPVHICQPA